MHKMERVTGIEPALTAWEAAALPLSYTRAATAKIAYFGADVKQPEAVVKAAISPLTFAVLSCIINIRKELGV